MIRGLLLRVTILVYGYGRSRRVEWKVYLRVKIDYLLRSLSFCSHMGLGHGWDVKCVQWHPTKGLLVSGSKDNQIKFWDPRTGTVLSTLYEVVVFIYFQQA